ncbi:hypothetical protein HDU96_010718 [Phlyctochytrium bullatum]|nr:hypothetical protein HDU96_010718 [Phlyctochytrium bullatum]
MNRSDQTSSSFVSSTAVSAQTAFQSSEVNTWRFQTPPGSLIHDAEPHHQISPAVIPPRSVQEQPRSFSHDAEPENKIPAIVTPRSVNRYDPITLPKFPPSPTSSTPSIAESFYETPPTFIFPEPPVATVPWPSPEASPGPAPSRTRGYSPGLLPSLKKWLYPGTARNKTVKENFLERTGKAAMRKRGTSEFRARQAAALGKMRRNEIIEARRQARVLYEQQNGLAPIVDLDDIYEQIRDILAVKGVYTPCKTVVLDWGSTLPQPLSPLTFTAADPKPPKPATRRAKRESPQRKIVVPSRMTLSDEKWSNPRTQRPKSTPPGRDSVKAAAKPDREQYRASRLRQAFQHGAFKRHAKVCENRGLPVDESLSPTSPPKRKTIPLYIGEALMLCREYNPDFEQDLNNWVPDVPSGAITLKDGQTSVSLLSIQGKDQAQANQDAFFQANRMMTETFYEKGILADLDRVVTNEFCVDIVRDASGRVIGAADYVFTKRYLYLDSLAVDKSARGGGISVLLLNRLKHVAHARGKEMLLFGLNDVTALYGAQGFKFNKELPREKYHMGRFMSWGAPTAAAAKY